MNQPQMRLAVKIFLASSFVASVTIFFVVICYRYPTEEEVLEHMPIPQEVIEIDVSESDIGLFKVSIKGKEEEWIETVPQWVLPWQKYDWSIRHQSYSKDIEQSAPRNR